MALLQWDAPHQRKIENGVSRGVLYPKGKNGVVWNGLIAVSERPTGAEVVNLYADNHKYGSLRTFEGLDATIEAYMYPEEFGECDGSMKVANGVKLGQQRRLPFDFCYRTEVFTAADNVYEQKYKLHLIYNATASPTDRNYQTTNESPDAVSMSWELHCMPFTIEGKRAASTIVIDSSEADRIKVEALEKILYGYGGEPPRMPSPDEVIKLIKRLDLHRIFLDVISKSGKWVWDTFNFREDTVPIAIDRESERHLYNEPESGTEYYLPAIAYSLLSESDKGLRKYMVIVADKDKPSQLVTDLKAVLDLTGEEIITVGGTHYFTYTLYI